MSPEGQRRPHLRAPPLKEMMTMRNHKFSIATFAVTLLVVFGFNQLLSAEPPTCQAAAGTSSVSVVLTEGAL
ncbi:hypothetical protein NBCG_05059 [Nocardioidaceae bacterium Broad-1]|nr:hypothetical protein NBCG_05059 [Nocardioidaceae bacterium Broad-1]